MKNIDVKRVCAVYFSPNGTVRKTAENIARGTGLSYTGYDLTPFDARWDDYVFSEDDLVIVAFPVYGGRLPGITREFFRHIVPGGAACVPVVVYGNRAYDDALLELYMTCGEKGFRTVAAAAFIGAHSMVPALAENRPDEDDVKEQESFGVAVVKKLENEENPFEKLDIKGSFPFKAQVMDRNLSPDIIKSGRGVIEPLICPVRAIDPDDPDNMDSKRCLLCLRCVRLYPGYRSAPGAMKDRLASIEKENTRRKPPEIFL